MGLEPHIELHEESLAFDPSFGFTGVVNSNGSKIRGSKIEDRDGSTSVAFSRSSVAVAVDLAWFLQGLASPPGGMPLFIWR